MRQFLISSLIFAICLKIAPILTLMVSWLPIEAFANFLFGIGENTANDPDALPKIIEALIWTLVIIYIILPLISYPLAAILPVATTYKDTRPLRLMRYIGLCILGLLLPALILIVTLTFIASLPAEEGSLIKGDVAISFAVSLLIIDKWFWGFVIAGLVSLALLHFITFKTSDAVTAFIRFWDAGFFGLGGSSRFANMIEEIADRWKKNKNSLFFGNSLFIPWLQIGRQDDRHMITFAGSRSGKGTSSIIPNLLAWQGSMLCIDPKGTNYHVTHRHRKTFSAVHAIDPFGVCGENTASFNPLAEIDVNDITALDQISTIAEAVIYDDSNSKNAYFTQEARAIFTGYTAYVLSNKKHYPSPNLIDVFNIIMRTAQEKKDLIHADMLQSQSPLSATIHEIANRIIEGEKDTGSEFYNVIQSLKNQIRWLASPAMKRVLCESTFSFKTMRDAPTSIYLILPPQEMKRYKKLQRLFINTAFSNVQKGGKSPTPCLFLIDEADSLGFMEEIQKGYGYLAGFNILIWTFWQDMGQLKALYKSSLSTFIGSSRAIQAFSVTDDITLEFIGKRLGNRRIGESINPFASRPDTRPFRERNEIEREISKESGQSYIIRHGKPAMLLRRVDYYKSGQWYDKAGSDPDYPDTQPTLSANITMLIKEAKEEIKDNPFNSIKFGFVIAFWGLVALGLIRKIFFS